LAGRLREPTPPRARNRGEHDRYRGSQRGGNPLRPEGHAPRALATKGIPETWRSIVQ
jgi:hypothetical protein